MNEQIINIKNLERFYHTKKGFIKKESYSIKALDNISFQVNKGEVFGLLGLNGAGKSTLMKILSTILIQNSGEAKMFNLDLKREENKIRPKINLITGSERNLYWRLSAYENLSYFADLYKVDKEVKNSKISSLLKLVGLTERANDKVETYSKGMKQRLQIARELINNPEILLLDKPTLGLDILTAKELRKIIKDLSSKGITVVFTTHYMYEAEEVCNRIAFIDKGKIKKIGTVDELKEHFLYKDVIKFRVQNNKENINKIESYKAFGKVDITQSTSKFLKVHIYTNNYLFVLKKVLIDISEKELKEVDIKKITLEDIYVKIMEGK